MDGKKRGRTGRWKVGKGEGEMRGERRKPRTDRIVEGDREQTR